ncbi:CNNM domain-containing protein [Crocinitomix catalasitica]|uniref:CNNM domain-containing protein n=1 Tax=Crocinitomix catalasitica TaxID=184607 RepID=UPI000482E7B9|nr:CNNM domain-containing protein [Crocinitomix catalasitica]
MTILLLFLTLSIGFSFLCSILEAVILSITPSFIRKQRDKNPQLYKDLNSFKEDIDKPLSAILTLNTIAHTVGAIGVGAQAAVVFGSTAINIFSFQIPAESIVATVMTLAILILSEIIPKTLGANYWKSLTPISIKGIKILMKILMPLVWMSQLITKKLKNDKNKSVLSRADLMALTLATKEDGALSNPETNVIQNVLNLPNTTIHDIMTPRAVLFATIENITVEDLSKTERFEQFSRIPVFAENKEEILGMVLKNDILWQLIEDNKTVKVKELIRPLSKVQEDELLADFFKRNYDKRAHMFIVEDTYGSITGVVTLEDILETILGYEIIDETDKIADMQTLVEKKDSKTD